MHRYCKICPAIHQYMHLQLSFWFYAKYHIKICGNPTECNNISSLIDFLFRFAFVSKSLLIYEFLQFQVRPWMHLKPPPSLFHTRRNVKCAKKLTNMLCYFYIWVHVSSFYHKECRLLIICPEIKYSSMQKCISEHHLMSHFGMYKLTFY